MDKTLGELSDEFDAAKKELEATSAVVREVEVSLISARSKESSAKSKVSSIRQQILDILNVGSNVTVLG